MERSGLKGLGRIPLMLFNGLVFDLIGMRQMGGFEDAVVTLSMEEMIRVQQAVYLGQMSNADSVFQLYRKANSQVSRFNARILSTRPEDNNYLNVLDATSATSIQGTRVCQIEFLSIVMILTITYVIFIQTI